MWGACSGRDSVEAGRPGVRMGGVGGVSGREGREPQHGGGVAAGFDDHGGPYGIGQPSVTMWVKTEPMRPRRAHEPVATRVPQI